MCVRNMIKQGDTETPRGKKSYGDFQGLHHSFK